MLKPDSRSHLMELLRPPAGCRFDRAIGTTFSLDLMSALMLPLSFVLFDWEREEGEPFDPLALLEALRLNGERFSVYCQAGNIRLPSKYSPLTTFLEPCIHEVKPQSPEGVFHPKVWVVRYLEPDDSVRYRVLCLSRNLTFDRSWDTAVALDGELTDRVNAIAANRPLADFVAALPGLCLHPLERGRRKSADLMAKELLRVRFDWPEEFDANECRFWTAGLTGRRSNPFGERGRRNLIVSPFLSDAVVCDFLAQDGKTHLVSRIESLQELPVGTLKQCASVHFLSPQLNEEGNDDVATPAPNEVLEGLHAKLFVIDRGWDASVFSGSFNATNHALEHNVEFMVEMVGKKSRVGVDRFLAASEKGSTGFCDILQPYDVNGAVVPADPLQRKFDDLFCAAKRSIVNGLPRLLISAGSQPELYNMGVQWNKLPVIPPSVQVTAWPITLPEERSLAFQNSMEFRDISHAAITPLLAFTVSAQIEGSKRECSFVMNLPMEGVPADRQDRVVAGLLEGKEQLLRYILFLLAAGDEDAATSGELATLLLNAGEPVDQTNAIPCLLETMLRALHRGPSQMERVSSLLNTLKRSGKGSELVGAEFKAIWEPIWEIAQQLITKK